ncbi:Putative membrane protein, partial [Candidatus Arthromitus sp. SFB-4]
MLNEIFNFEKLFDTFNYVFWFFILNLLFWIFNIPIILFFMFIGISRITTYFPLFLVCLLPTAPIFTVLLYCVNK